MPRPRIVRRTVMQGMTHTATSSTGGVARERLTRRRLGRGATAIQPAGSAPA